MTSTIPSSFSLSPSSFFLSRQEEVNDSPPFFGLPLFLLVGPSPSIRSSAAAAAKEEEARPLSGHLRPPPPEGRRSLPSSSVPSPIPLKELTFP